MKKRVLIFCDFYPPAQGGGGMFAVANIVERFADRYDFFVVTRHTMSTGDNTQVPGIRLNEWQSGANCLVYFADVRTLDSIHIKALFRTARPDVVFLNSMFSRPVRSFLLARAKADGTSLPVILAPCGELLPAALASKRAKKIAFLAYARFKDLYRGVIWRASFETERAAIEKFAGAGAVIHIAPDLTPAEILPQFQPGSKPTKTRGSVKLVFAARIVRLKNLHFLLDCLSEITEGDIELAIVGPPENRRYWSRCKRRIQNLPPNIRVEILGGVPREQVLDRFVQSHYFVLPTLSENFGYVFLEALAAGCPILISDRTDWGSVEKACAGKVNSPTDKDAWINAIRACVEQDDDGYQEMSRAARAFAMNWLGGPANERATAQLLDFAINQGGGRST